MQGEGLKACSDCGYRHSTYAIACPRCGRPKSVQNNVIILIVIIAAFGALFIIRALMLHFWGIDLLPPTRK
jgi:uncharacterized paraquat-inducible protein A